MAGAGGTGLPILRELLCSIFLKASVSNTLGLSIKLLILINIKHLSNVSASVIELLSGSKNNTAFNT